jgi:2-polyprenyl-6-methoxyphenol hydroxylase-like FAD-dependent oxidoreductase
VTIPRTHAIVIGASIAGLVAARVLSDHVDDVTILERDQLTREATTRRGVPQGRHAHVLLAKGRQLLDGWFPGLSDELVARGAVPMDTRDLVWHQAGDHRVRPDLGVISMSMSRPLLEGTIREHLVERSNVTIIDGTSVEGLIIELGRVRGVHVDGAPLRADLVVDCTGRKTRSFDQLAGAGFPTPEVSAIRIDMAYGTRVIRRRPGTPSDRTVVVIGDPRQGHRMATMVPIEGDRTIITAGGFHGDRPPTDPDDCSSRRRRCPPQPATSEP